MNPIDITVIITAHAEGILAHRTLRSVAAATAHAAQSSISSEIIVVLDLPSPETENYFEQQTEAQLRLLVVKNSDAGLSRNDGVRCALGKYVTFVDADDLIGRSWLLKAFEKAESQSNGLVVMHPEFTLTFDASQVMTRHRSSNEASFSPSSLADQNPWTSIAFTTRSIMLGTPFTATPEGSGFGYEDWHWYCNLLDHDISVHPVVNTCAFIRRKHTGSRHAQHVTHNSLLAPTNFFRKLGWIRINGAALSSRSRVTSKRATRVSNLASAVQNFQHTLRIAAIGTARRAVRLFPSALPTMQRVYKGWEAWEMKRFAKRLPGWLFDEWRDLHDIEPLLFPDHQSLSAYRSLRPPPSFTGPALTSLLRHIGGPVDYVFLLPWLKLGGSTLEAFNYMQALRHHDPQCRIAVIVTDDPDTALMDRLPAGVTYIPFVSLTTLLNKAERQYLLAMLLVQLSPSVVHNLNSRLGYQSFISFGAALSNVSKLFTSVFCEDINPDGRLVGYPFDCLPQCFSHLTGVFCDNGRFLRKLREWYAYPVNRLYVHRHPVDPVGVNDLIHPSTNAKFNVLWAGRLDRQKRPDLLKMIIQRCQDIPVHFHVFGASVLASDAINIPWNKLANTTYYGRYSNFPRLDKMRFDAFLFTSQWEGMPNVVLEALAHGLPVIAPDVGGVAEVIEHNVTGLLIDDFADVDEYCKALRQLMTDSKLRSTLSTNGKQLVEQCHSREAFAKSLHASPGYLVTREPVKGQGLLHATV